MTVDPLEAFGLFYKDNSGPVFRALLAGTLNRAAAEDATAEAFARAFAHWDTVASHPNPKASVLVATMGSPLVGRPAGAVAATGRILGRSRPGRCDPWPSQGPTRGDRARRPW